MILQLKAKHFVGTEYTDSMDCPIARAAKEQIPNVVFASEGVDNMYVEVKLKWWQFWKEKFTVFNHEPYNPEIFDQDKEIALDRANPNSVIRKIELL
jgi:hypothetical protein